MKHSLKYLLAWIVCFGLRLIPFRPANAEPLMGTLMPMGKLGVFGPLGFTVSSIVIYDAVTAGTGPVTWLVAGVYGLISLAASAYFQNRVATRYDYAGFAIVATLVFDAATGLTMGPLFFHQSFMNALIGQIPFTASHLISNVAIALVVSPIISKYLIQNSALELSTITEYKKKAA